MKQKNVVKQQSTLTRSSLAASEKAIQYHYDLGNEFYQAILDETMSYTAGLWPDDETTISLRESQIAKLNWHLAAADIRSGDHVLDIGCGWGSFMRHAASQMDIASCTGLTLSQQQHDWMGSQFQGSNISSHLCSWETFRPDEAFDGIVAIGVMEHFAKPDLSLGEKVEAYRRFFEFCYKNLSPTRSLSIQAIVWMEMETGSETSNLPLHFFPESDLPYVHELVTAATPYFHLMSMSNRPKDYSKTLREWLRNLRTNEDTLIDVFGKTIVRRYSREFTSFVMGFDRQKIGLCRMSFQRRTAPTLLREDLLGSSKASIASKS